jgi:hypothetical protein
MSAPQFCGKFRHILDLLNIENVLAAPSSLKFF